MENTSHENNALALPEEQSLTGLGEIRLKEYIPEELSLQELLERFHTSQTTWREMMTYYHCAMMEVETKFRVLDQEFSLHYDRNPIESIKTRLKSPESLLEKLHRKRLAPSLEAIETGIADVAGVRVICSFVDDIYMLEQSFLRQDDVRLLERKDYIRSPKPSGYRGLHLVVETPIFLHNEKRMMKVEVQLRTIAMDFWASLEHKLRYKKRLDAEVSAAIEVQLSDYAETLYQLDVGMQQLKKQIDSFQELP